MQRQADGPAPPQPPARPVVGLPHFAGRVRELEVMREALADGQPLVIVEGEAGIGKSRLLRELLGDETDGVVFAMCPPLRHPQTLAPMVDAIRRSTYRPDALGLSKVAGVLRPLLPEWGDALPPALDPAQDPTVGRHRLFRALMEVLQRVRARLLVVEDVHWADETTLEFLLFLRTQPVQQFGMVVTSRPEDVLEGSLLRRLSAHRSTGGHTRRIRMGPLDVAETTFLVSSMMADRAVSTEFVRFLHERTDGVPLAVEESVRLLADRAAVPWTNDDLGNLAVPETIRDAVLERVERLIPPARQVLRAAAVLDEPATELALLTVSGPGSSGVPDALASGLIAEQRRGLIGFRHALASQAVYEAIPAADRRALHRRAAEMLAAGTGASPGRLARHFFEAGDTGNWLRYGERAADIAVAAGDEVTADRILHELIVAGGLSPSDIARLAGKLSFAIDVSGGELTAVLRSTLASGGMTEAVQAVLRLQYARALETIDEHAAARPELERAVTGLTPGSVEAAWVMHKLARPLDKSSPAKEHLRWLERSEAVPVAGTAVDRLRLRVDRISSLLTLGEQSGWAEAEQILDRDVSDQPSYLIALLGMNVADLALRWGRYEDARRRQDAAISIAQDHGYLAVRCATLLSRAHLSWFRGEWGGLADQTAHIVADQNLKAGARAEALVVEGMLHAAAGERERARTLLSRAVMESREHSSIEYLMEPAAALARVMMSEGDAEGALRVTDESMDVIEAKGIWLWAVEPLPVRVAALAATGRVEEATVLIKKMVTGMRGTQAPAAVAALTISRATIAETAGDDAVAAYDAAERAWLALPRPYDALRARERRARCMLATGGRKAGLSLLTEVANDLSRLGAMGDADRVFRDLRGHGIAVRRPVTGRPGYGGGLSPRELEVVRLLAVGKTDREIADTLVLSPKTVATHLSSARRKLRVPSRIALAVAAIDAGLVADQRT